MTIVMNEGTSAEKVLTHRGPLAAQVEAPAAAPNRLMIDSAWPVPQDKTIRADIVLLYCGGDTPHPWTQADIAAMPERYRYPCWVRSDPQDVSAGQDAALFAAWLHGHQVPMGTCVILDLETAVNGPYVTAFNLAMRAAGYKVTKYGSQNYIWQNPQTDGGTYVALPGPAVLTTEGDTVARQYAFDGSYDLSVVKPQSELPLWDMQPPPPPPPPSDSYDWADQVDADLQVATARLIAARAVSGLPRGVETDLRIAARRLEAARTTLLANIR
jgi:hypothetical protein